MTGPPHASSTSLLLYITNNFKLIVVFIFFFSSVGLKEGHILSKFQIAFLNSFRHDIVTQILEDGQDIVG